MMAQLGRNTPWSPGISRATLKQGVLKIYALEVRRARAQQFTENMADLEVSFIRTRIIERYEECMGLKDGATIAA